MPIDNLRLDASESAFFARQLESIDQTMYETVYPDLKARSFVPTAGGIPDWARVYTWREFSKYGAAKFVSNMADDIPRADVSGTESSKIIKPCASSYGYDIMEIKAAAGTGTPLDAMKAAACKFAVDSLLDDTLALGSADHNLDGLLSLTGTTSYTPATKAHGGKTWDLATPDEIADDLAGCIKAIRDALKGSGSPMFSSFDVILPTAQYTQIAQKRMGDGSSVTILKFLLESNPFINTIEEWHLATGAGAGATDRMVVYPRNPLVLAGIVPMEFSPQPPQQHNLEYVVNCLATCGGVVARYPVAVAYGDGI